MKYNLDISERLILRSMLLEMGGSYADLVLAKKTADDVFGEQELKDYNVRLDGGSTLWEMADSKGRPLPVFKEIELGLEAVKLVRAHLAKLSEAKALQRFHVSLYEQFVADPAEEARRQAAEQTAS